MKTQNRDIWPNFFIVGAARAGTTSLYHYLKANPSVYMSPFKEPSYFSDYRGYDKDKYLKLFDGVTDETAIGEATPAYLADPTTPGRIHDTIHNARIIMILRDPVERMFSEWFMNVNYWFHETLPLGELLESTTKIGKMRRYIRSGLYTEQVQRYLDAFGASQVKIIIFEEFIRDPKQIVDDTLQFLGVIPAGFQLGVYTAHNSSSDRSFPKNKLARRLLRSRKTRWLARSRLVRPLLEKEVPKPKLEPIHRKRLEDLYREDARKLSQILKRPLPWVWAYQ